MGLQGSGTKTRASTPGHHLADRQLTTTHSNWTGQLCIDVLSKFSHCNFINGILFFSFRGTLSAFSNAPGTLSTRLGNGNTTLLASGGGNSNQAPPGAGAAAVLHRRSSPNSSSAYSQSQWRVQKDNMSGVGRCSWKFVAIFFMLLSVILVSALIYTTGKICSTSAICAPYTFPQLKH